jgi:hypothetical protein
MDADDASSAEVKRLFANPELDPLALDEDTAERLLDGDLPPAQAPPGYEQVAALLAATVAAPSAEELAGKAAAMAELQTVTRARLAATPRRAGRPARRRRVGLAVAVVVGALSTGGIAAATTGHLPGPIRDAARSIRSMFGDAAPATPTEPGRQVPSTGLAGPTRGQGAQPGGAAGPGAGTTAVTGAARDGLCRAFTAGEGSEKGKRLDAVAFQALADAAGGADKIPTYCQGTQAGGGPKGQGKPAQPGNQGNGQGGGPPPSTNGGNPGQGGPPDTRSHGG